MKKMGKMVLFLLVLGLGIVIIDNVVFGIPGTSCHCHDTTDVDEECYNLCYPAECDGAEIWFGSAFCCDDYTCCTGVTCYCSDRSRERYYIYDMCSSCFGIEM